MIELHSEIEFTSEQFSVSTAEDEHNYFTGQAEIPVRPNPSVILQPGTYRIVEGGLYRILGGLPLNLPSTRGLGAQKREEMPHG